MKRRAWVFGLIVVSLAATGCGASLDDTYGRVGGASLNGTRVLFRMFAAAGHRVRVARRLTDEVARQADVIVRFAPRPGTIDREEADWYVRWQMQGPNRRLIYVCRDHDAAVDYWNGVLADLEPSAGADLRKRVERLRDKAEGWASRLPSAIKEEADATYWFGLEPPGEGPRTASELSGPWAEGVEAKAAALPRRRALRVGREDVLLSADGRTLVMQWSWDEGPAAQSPDLVLVVANAGFLLNAALVNPARRPLAARVVEWAGVPPRTVVFVEGENLFADREGQPSAWELVRRLPTLAWVLGHFAVLGVLAALASAMILGRPRPAPDPGADRPRAHAEALGALLARTRDEGLARSQLEAYRRWRHPGA